MIIDITKHFKVILIKYAEHAHEMYEISCYLYPPSKEHQELNDTELTAQNKHFSEEVIHKDIKYVPPTAIWEDKDDKDPD